MTDHRQQRTRGRRWMALKEYVLMEQPVCAVCNRKPATEVDHIVPISKGGSDERDNLQGLCYGCHEEKTRVDLGITKKARKIGLDGYPKKDLNDGQEAD